MIKGLEALEEMRDEAVSDICRYIPKKAHKEVAEWFDERKSIIEKELEALEIIKEKKVNVWFVLRVSLEEYNTKFVNQDWRKLTQEDYDCLKEVLK